MASNRRGEAGQPILVEGALSKQGKLPGQWAQRYFVLSEHEALGLRIEATRAQCEECFGAALFERVYRALRDASDAQNRTVDDLQVRWLHLHSIAVVA